MSNVKIKLKDFVTQRILDDMGLQGFPLLKGIHEAIRDDGGYKFTKGPMKGFLASTNEFEEVTEDLGLFGNYRKHEVVKVYEVTKEIHVKAGEVVLEQNGHCTHPIRVNCNDCPLCTDGCISSMPELRVDVLKLMGF